jgi:hypothetical protein
MKFFIPLEIIQCLWFWVVYAVFYETPKKKVERAGFRSGEYGDHAYFVLYDINLNPKCLLHPVLNHLPFSQFKTIKEAESVDPSC